MGFFNDVAKFGTNITRQVDTFVVKNAGAIPVVGGALTSGASFQLQQLNAIDKATGNIKQDSVGVDVDELITQKANQKQIDFENQKAILEKTKKDKEQKIIIYSFIGLGVILVGAIAYLNLKKK